MRVKCVKNCGSTFFKIGETYDCVPIKAGINMYKVESKKGSMLCTLNELEKGNMFKIISR